MSEPVCIACCTLILCSVKQAVLCSLRRVVVFTLCCCLAAAQVAHHVPWGPTGCGTAPLVHGAALLVVCVCKEMAPCGP
jgi:hypothetical protein